MSQNVEYTARYGHSENATVGRSFNSCASVHQAVLLAKDGYFLKLGR